MIASTLHLPVNNLHPYQLFTRSIVLCLGLLYVLTEHQFILLLVHDIYTAILFSLTSTNCIKRMQKNNSAALHQACAACKHQRKRCGENCVLAPFFPAEKGENFQAVHKVFGVSNVQKIVKSLDSFESRKKAVESLTWEALWRQKDPVNGSLGEYMRVFNELQSFKGQHGAMMCKSLSALAGSGLVGWNNNGMRMSMETGANNNNNDAVNYMRSNGNLILNGHPYSYPSQIEGGQDSRRDVVCPQQPMTPQPMNYYNPDHFNRLNVKSIDNPNWNGGI